MTTALEQALDFHKRHKDMDRQARFDAAVALGEWGVFSARNIADIVGLPKNVVPALIGKKSRDGGKLNPAALEHIAEVARLWRRGEVDVFATKRAIDAGTTTWVVARLTGISRSQIRRQYEKAVKLTGEGRKDAAS
jgi:hypothetical protein